MFLKRLKINQLILFMSVASLAFYGCGGSREGDEDKPKVVIDSNKTDIINIGGALFSIPSPIQTSILLKKTGANYNKEILNSTKSSANYSTNFKKAVNLGVYGADLGYVTIYEQTQDAIGYLQAVKKMGDDLGVSGAFDATLMKRFEANLGNKDSLLGLVSSAYRASDAYLKNNERNEVSGLIIAGGWVESLYFSTKIAEKNKGNKDVIQRIAEQKNALDNLIKLLTPYYQDPEYTEFIDALIDLAYDFDGIEMKYTFVAPTTDAKNKITTINSKSEIVITDDQLKAITEKVDKIRTSIIG